eukprot:TRINITY_DN50139_c0_g1_i2.p1 TRINITY_DN50139_c0_g1~~TRINITY_DN50139_c0_g1_i2.p1  ORF type:complete len:227 (+),score=66.72 TRINITY_DN50139_c0_g1_i2:251-931(+)
MQQKVANQEQKIENLGKPEEINLRSEEKNVTGLLKMPNDTSEDNKGEEKTQDTNKDKIKEKPQKSEKCHIIEEKNYNDVSKKDVELDKIKFQPKKQAESESEEKFNSPMINEQPRSQPFGSSSSNEEEDFEINQETKNSFKEEKEPPITEDNTKFGNENIFKLIGNLIPLNKKNEEEPNSKVENSQNTQALEPSILVEKKEDPEKMQTSKEIPITVSPEPSIHLKN